MDTVEARRGLRGLAQEALELLQDLLEGRTRRSQALNEMRSMENEARSLLADAGYPGESAWRALNFTCRLLDEGGEADEERRTQAILELASAVELLDSLLAAPGARDPDVRIVG